MSGFTGHQASDAGEKAGRANVVLNYRTAQGMLPLAQRIVDDILHQRQLLAKLGVEQEHLDDARRNLKWPQRRRRYEVHEDYAAAQHNLEDALAELEVLGVTLVDSDLGQVGLPTVVNGRPAYFSWKPGESALQYWHFAEETQRRTIPASWCDLAKS